MAIVLTDTAVSEVKRVLEQQQHPEWGLKLGVKAGGCSGLEYAMDITDAPAANDQVFEFDGLRVFIDPKSYLFLNGMTLDYKKELLGGGFKFVNPNATKTCGCGTSFAA
jgi:iron-sulfur cluster assembly protein